MLSGLVLIVYSISAQIPERAEDISPLLIGETIPDVFLKSQMRLIIPYQISLVKNQLSFYFTVVDGDTIALISWIRCKQN